MPAVNRVPAPSVAHATMLGQAPITSQHPQEVLDAHDKFKKLWTQIRNEAGQAGEGAAVDDLFARAATRSVTGAEFVVRVKAICNRTLPPEFVYKLDKLFVRDH